MGGKSWKVSGIMGFLKKPRGLKRKRGNEKGPMPYKMWARVTMVLLVKWE